MKKIKWKAIEKDGMIEFVPNDLKYLSFGIHRSLLKAIIEYGNKLIKKEK